MSEPEKYNLQRTLGVSALHPLLINILAIMSSKGLSVVDQGKFAEVLDTPLKDLGALNPEGDWVQGDDFWRRGASGASGLYNTRAGYRVLQAQLTEKLPPVSID